MKFPSIPHGSSPATISAITEAVEILTGRRRNTTIDYGSIGGQEAPEFGIYDLASLVDAIGAKHYEHARLGYLERPVFAFVDTDTITIGPGVYHHMGTTDQFVHWDSTLTFNATLSGTQFNYLYLDDSEIAKRGLSSITAQELVLSTTAPTYLARRHGWYNGLDRCIGAFRVTSDAFAGFYHDGGSFLQYATPLIDRGTSDLASAETVAVSIPAVATRAIITFELAANGAYLLNVGPDANGLAGVGYGTASVTQRFRVETFVSSAREIYVTLSDYTNTNSLNIRTNGWFFPAGM